MEENLQKTPKMKTYDPVDLPTNEENESPVTPKRGRGRPKKYFSKEEVVAEKKRRRDLRNAEKDIRIAKLHEEWNKVVDQLFERNEEIKKLKNQLELFTKDIKILE
jgi:succinate dehydrogenase/fumarate reductase flavoprotein subunit